MSEAGKILKSIKQTSQHLSKTEAMQETGIDICSLPEVDYYKHLVICTD